MRSASNRAAERYVRLGISARKAWALLKVEKATVRSDEFARAYADGALSWVRAITLLPVLERENAAAWIARARTVTVRRLCDEVNHVLEARDVLGPSVPLDPPPAASVLASPIATLVETECRHVSRATGADIGAHCPAGADGWADGSAADRCAACAGNRRQT